MQAIANMTSTALAPPPSMQPPDQGLGAVILAHPALQTGTGGAHPLAPPTNASPQSVVQAQIETEPDAQKSQTDETVSSTFAKQAEDAARTKSMLEVLPANPTQVTKLMSALSTATSAEDLADIADEKHYA